MTSKQLANILEKAASHIERLEIENASLRKTASRATIKKASADVIEKLSLSTGYDESKVLDIFDSMSDEQRGLIEKMARDESLGFLLGETSSLNDKPMTAEQALIEFARY